MTYAAQEKFTLAEAPLRRACQLDSSDPDSCYYWGRTLFALRRFEQSVAAYEKALKTNHRPGRVYLGLALSHEKLDRFAEAKRCFRLAVEAGERRAAGEYERFVGRTGQEAGK